MKTTTIKTLLLAVSLITYSGSNFASNNCIKGYTQTDVCKVARDFSDKVAPSLPMKMSQNMTWESVAAAGTIVIAKIRLSTNKNNLQTTYKNAGLPLSSAEAAMAKSAQNVCNTKAIKSFINFGGTFRYIYTFIDGEQFTTIDVKDCN